MAHSTDDKDSNEALTPEERERRSREGKRHTLDEEIVRKYEPERLKRLVGRGAGRGERLDLSTRSEMAGLIPGHDFSNVRVFRGPLAEEVTKHHKADAVTIGNTGMILVRESPRSAPGTSAGRALLAHELTHVAQAQRGMLFAKEGGASGNGDHEKEAEGVEARALAGRGGRQAPKSDRKEAQRRELIMHRVFELMDEGKRMADVRHGRTWTK